MAFLKSLIIAVFATIVLTYFFGVTLIEWFNIDLNLSGGFAQDSIEPLKKISVSAILAVVLLIVAVIIVFSVFGTIIVATFLSIGLILMLLLGAFWPIVFIGLIIWYAIRTQKLAS
jgi:small-conductance mechanosensitive channel